VYLVDTDVISEARKRDQANAGVKAFFATARRENVALFLWISRLPPPRCFST
jgi:hypothetical protein